MLHYKIRGKTAKKGIPCCREVKIDLRELLCQGIKIPEGRENTPQDISCHCKAVLQKNLDPLLEGNRSTKNNPPRTLINNSSQMDTGTQRQERIPPGRLGRLLLTKLHGKSHKVTQATLVPPLKMLKMKQWGGTLKRVLETSIFSQKDTSENQMTTNIERVGPRNM